MPPMYGPRASFSFLFPMRTKTKCRAIKYWLKFCEPEHQNKLSGIAFTDQIGQDKKELCVRIVITICVERLLRFALKILLHFTSMLLHFALILHFATILITFCVNITFCGVTHEIHRQGYPYKKAPLRSFIFWIKALAMQHRIVKLAVILSFLIIFLIFLISLGEMSLNFATLY